MEATRRYIPSIGWTHSRAFETPEQRHDYEAAFASYPSRPLPDCEASRLGHADAARTAKWRAEREVMA